LQFFGTCVNPEQNEFVIVMELMPRGSLYRMIHSVSAITPEQVRNYLLDAARGMDYLHNHEPLIIHRDLKSHNLLISDSDSIKVCDFGLAKIMGPANSTMTQSGTPAWAAPEVLRCERYNQMADVYSYGVVIWELLSRDVPFSTLPPFQIVTLVGHQGIRLPILPTWPQPYVQLMTACWAEKPVDRPTFSTIQQLLLTM